MLAQLFLFALLPASLPESRPVLAVFDFTAKDVLVERATLERLTDELVVELTRIGFAVVPRETLRQKLEKLKGASFQVTFDDQSQLALGQELAASKSVVTELVPVGDRCRARAVLFDLEKSTSERAVSLEAPCAPSALMGLLPQLARELAGEAPKQAAAATVVSNPAPEPSLLSGFFFCARGYGGPTLLGWCGDGQFVGLVHLGSIAYASTDEDLYGVSQIAIVSRVAGDFIGGVQGGFLNLTHGGFSGIVQGGGVNWVGRDFVALSQAGAVNWVEGVMVGSQLGGFNRADRVRGIQIGVLNVASDLRGIQLGLLNFAGNGILPVMPILNAGF